MEIEGISKEELRERLHEPATVIIDVRRDQKEAKLKISNSRLHDPDRVSSWAGNYRRDQTLVLYYS
jgi:hypothetical protein